MMKEKILLGRLLAEKIKNFSPFVSLSEVEFSVFSQFGEDGIIQFIIQHLKSNIKNNIFVEIGVQNYIEANTRFLLENNDWQGVIVDGNDADIQNIKQSDWYWRHHLLAKQAFITRENINSFMMQFDLPREIGLLSLDIDGNDYWVLEQLNVLDPAIIVLEYNAFFGKHLPISIPYQPNFIWKKYHPAVYFGASLPAFDYLLKKRDYTFLGCTRAGNNAFFVKESVNQGILPAVSVEKGYRVASFNHYSCETLNKQVEQLKYLENQEVMDVTSHILLKWSMEETF